MATTGIKNITAQLVGDPTVHFDTFEDAAGYAVAAAKDPRASDTLKIQLLAELCRLMAEEIEHLKRVNRL